MAHLCDYLAFPKRIRGGGGVERKLHGGLTQNLGSGEWIRYGTPRVRKRTRRTSSRATRVTVKSWTPWQRAAQRGGEQAPAPRLCRPGYPLVSCGPRAKCSLLPPGIGTFERSGSPGCALRAATRLSVPPVAHYRARCPGGTLRSPRTAPGGGRERKAGARRGDRRARQLTSGRGGRQQSPGQGEQEGAGGGCGRRARCHGRRPSVQQLSGPSGERCTIPRGRRAGAGRRDPRDFLPQGVSPEALAQRPRRRGASLGFHFF